jgi:hypothetical protein
MRRKRSDELPRFEEDYPDPLNCLDFRWRRRYWLYIAIFFLFAYLLLPSHPTASTQGTPGAIDWSKYAYSLYATDSATLCHALLVLDALSRLGSKADRVLFYPNYWDTVIRDSKDRDSQLLVIARDRYKVKLQPIQLLTVEGRTKGTSYGISTEHGGSTSTCTVAHAQSLSLHAPHMCNAFQIEKTKQC